MAPSVGSVASTALLVAVVLGCLAWVVHRYAVVELLRTGARILRLDRTALAAGGVLVVAGGGLVATVADPAAPLRSALVALLAAVGVAGATVAVANADWYRASRSLPVVAPGAVEPGPVQVEGRAVALDDLVESSVTHTESVAYRAVTREERAIAGRGYATTAWSPTSTAFDAVPFGLEGAAVVVEGPAAEFPLLSPTSRLVGLSPAAATLEGLERTVPAEPGTTVPVGDDLGRGERPRPRRYSERRIDPGDEVYVLGTAVWADGAGGESGTGLRIVADPDGPPLLVVRCPAEEAIAHARKLVVGYGSVGLASLAGALGLAATLV